MTLCVAAFSSNKVGEYEVVCCSDTRIETRSTGSETVYKFRKVSNQFAALYAGTVSRADELLHIYTEYLAGRELTRQNIVEELRVPPQKLKRRLVEEYVRNTLGLGFDEFLAKSTSFPSGLHENILTEISRIQIDCQLLLVSLRTDLHALFTVDTDGAVFEEENFAAIGSGASNAIAWLHFRKQQQYLATNVTILHVWEAKKFSDNAPGVGRETNLVWIDKELNLYQSKPNLNFNNHWRKFGPRDTKSFKADVKTAFFDTPAPWLDVGIG